MVIMWDDIGVFYIYVVGLWQGFQIVDKIKCWVGILFDVQCFV